MNEFMNVLNTEVGLYEILDIVLNDPSISSTMNEETLDTAHLFWRDFQKSGIHLPRKQRDRFVSLSSEILELGWQFQANGGTAEPARILLSELEGLKDHGLGARLKQRVKFASRELLIYPGSLQAQMIMRSAPSEDVRRKVYIACNSSPPERIAILERLLRARGELARLVGKDSYAQMALEHTMAGTPENVTNFLGALVANNRPRAHDALRALSMRKQTHLGTASLPTIQAWDRDYYCPPEPAAPPISLPPLTPGTVFMGLSRLFRHLYGISLRPAEIAPGEVWHTDVRKLEVVDENMGVLGWLYADLFSREGKGSGSAHYTIRCARRVDKDDIAGDLHFGYHPNVVGYDTLAGTSIEFEGAHRRQLSGKPGIYQLPVIALVCDFARPSAHRGAAAMEWQEVKTLYHEMGHAMHSMIGQTEYHNVAGTRCTTDFVELPSILMEHFLESETVLSLFDKTDGSHTRQVGNHHEDPCRSIDTHWQIMLAAMDQVYHSSDVLDPGFDSTVALARLHDEQGVIPFVPGTSSQTQFGHLYSYGATYYSYAFDRAIASRVWRQVFANDPLSRETGEKYKRDILRHGAVGNPWHLVANLLDAPELAMGKAEAMREVGSWRIEDDMTIAGTH